VRDLLSPCSEDKAKHNLVPEQANCLFPTGKNGKIGLEERAIEKRAF
jgi:hypothetical protein